MDILKNLKRLGGKKNIWDKKMILKFWDGFLVRYRKTYVLKNDKWMVKRELKEKKKKKIGYGCSISILIKEILY